MSKYTITADSTPDYDEWGWDDYWSCDDWITWHKALLNKHGKQKAHEIWLQAWNKQDIWESNYNWCKYKASFNKYVRDNELNVTHLLSDIIVGGTNIGGNIVGAAEETSKAPLNIAKVLKWLIPTLVIIAAILLVFWAIKKYDIKFNLK